LSPGNGNEFKVAEPDGQRGRQTRRGFLLEAITKNSAAFKHMDVPLKKDKEVYLRAVAKNSNVLNLVQHIGSL